jgi:hypothetical protein
MTRTITVTGVGGQVNNFDKSQQPANPTPTPNLAKYMPPTSKKGSIMNVRLQKKESQAALAVQKRSLIPARRHTSRTLVEKVVEKTFGAENKEVIFQKYSMLQDINKNTGDVQIARGSQVLREELHQEHDTQQKIVPVPRVSRKMSNMHGGLPIPGVRRPSLKNSPGQIKKTQTNSNALASFKLGGQDQAGTMNEGGDTEESKKAGDALDGSPQTQ